MLMDDTQCCWVSGQQTCLLTNLGSSSPTMLQQSFCREMAQSLGREPTLQGGGVDHCFLFHYGDVLLKRNLVAQDEDNFRKGIVMCVFPQWPVCTVLFWNLYRNILPLLAELVFTVISQLHTYRLPIHNQTLNIYPTSLFNDSSKVWWRLVQPKITLSIKMFKCFHLKCICVAFFIQIMRLVPTIRIYMLRM